MNQKILKKDIEKYLKKIKTDTNNIDEYYTTKLLHEIQASTTKNHLIAINQLFIEINKKNPKKFTKTDILNFLKSEWFGNLSDLTKNGIIARIKLYLKFSERNDLVEILPKRKRAKAKEISKNDLVNREQLKLILTNSSFKLKTMLAVGYDCALRRDELLNIRRKDINLADRNLFVHISKTSERNLPITDSLPYLQQYFKEYGFESNDIIFHYARPEAFNVYLQRLSKKLTKKYPEKWNDKKLFPHLLRHSRLTELALTKLNEAQLRKFAGWSASSEMPAIYFHLDDSDIRKIILGDKKPKEIKDFKEINCPYCNTINTEADIYCINCGEILDNINKIKKIELERQKDLKEVKEQMDILRKLYLDLKKSIESKN